MKIYLILIFMLLTGCSGGEGKKDSQEKVSQANIITIKDSFFEIQKGTEFSGKLTASHNNNLPISFELVSAPHINDFQLASSGEFIFSVDKFESIEQTNFTVKALADNTPEQTATIEISFLAPDNIAPKAEQSSISVPLDNVHAGTLIATDSDGDPLSFELVEDVTLGSLTLDHTSGEYIYISPFASEEVQTSFTFRVFDGITWSDPQNVLINFQDQNNELSQYSYQLFGNTQDPQTGVFVLPKADANQEEIFSENIEIILPTRLGSFTSTDHQFTYQPNKNAIELENAENDRVVIALTDRSGNRHIIKYEFYFAAHVIVYDTDLQTPLAPEWSSDADFPEQLDDILNGVDPFDPSFEHTNDKFLQAIKALDTLALTSTITDERLAYLTYYIRAHIYHTDSDNLSQSQLDALDVAGLRITQMPGFYGMSQSATKLHMGFTDVVYALNYFGNKHPDLTKYFDISLALVNLYSRFNGNHFTYELQEGIYNVFDLIDRIAYSFKHSSNREYVSRYYNDHLLTTLSNLAHSKLVPIEGDYFLLYNIFSLGYELWLDDNTVWQESLDQAIVALTRATLEGSHEDDAKQIKISFYSYYLTNAVGHQNPDLAISQCNQEHNDICYIISEQEALPNSLSCNNFAEFRFDSLSIEQQDNLCHALVSTANNFHNVLQTNQLPVADDHNDKVYASIFNSSQDYGAYGYALYQIPTDNGGFYLEGSPSNDDNIARLFVYQQGQDDDWWVWNWEHEFTHYLDGRYIKYGDFGYLSTDLTTWWTEGLAEYIAWSDEFPRGYYVIHSTPEENWPTIEEISVVNYNSSSQLIYSWSYTLHRFLVENYLELHQALKHCLIEGDLACYQEQTAEMITLESEYKQWLLVLSQTTPKSGNGKYTAEEYQRDAVKLRMHSQNHVTNTQKYKIKR